MVSLEEEVSRLYSEPGIGTSNINTYGEENILSLLQKFRALKSPENETMLEMVRIYSRSGDLNSCYLSVAVLHALGHREDVDAAYDWAQTQGDPQMFIHHFDIGISLADYLAKA